MPTPAAIERARRRRRPRPGPSARTTGGGRAPLGGPWCRRQRRQIGQGRHLAPLPGVGRQRLEAGHHGAHALDLATEAGVLAHAALDRRAPVRRQLAEQVVHDLGVAAHYPVLVVEHGAQPAQPAHHVGLDGAERHAGALGDLALAEPLVEAHPQDCRLVLGQASQPHRHSPALHERVGRRLGVVLGLPHREAAGRQRVARLGHALAQVVDRPAAGDQEDPGPERRAAPGRRRGRGARPRGTPPGARPRRPPGRRAPGAGSRARRTRSRGAPRPGRRGRPRRRPATRRSSGSRRRRGRRGFRLVPRRSEARAGVGMA